LKEKATFIHSFLEGNLPTPIKAQAREMEREDSPLIQQFYEKIYPEKFLHIKHKKVHT